MEELNNLKQQILSQSYDNSAYNYSIHHSEARNARAESENERRFNYEQSQLDKLFQVMMKEYENAYNSPSAQKSRFLAAGINPYLAMYAGAQNLTDASSPPVSHGVSGSGAGAQAAAGSAEAARTQAVVASAGQLNDSVSSYFKNLVTNEEAKQQQFKTLNMERDYMVDLEGRVRELQSKRNRTRLEELELESKTNELEDYYATRSSHRQRPALENNALVAQANNANRSAQLANEQAVTEEMMRDVRNRAAEKGIKLDEAKIRELNASAQRLVAEARRIGQENEYFEYFGETERLRSERGQNAVLEENVKRLRSTYNDYVDELHNKKLISDEEYKAEKARAKEMSDRQWYYSLTHMNGMDIDDPGGYGVSVIPSAINFLTSQFGQLLGGANGAAAASWLVK